MPHVPIVAAVNVESNKLQSELESEPLDDVWPLGQSMHIVVISSYVPAGQVMQLEEPPVFEEEGWYLPAEQSWHELPYR